MTTTFGEVSWEDDLNFGRETNKKFSTGGKDLFLRLKDGDNEMRLITRPHQYMTHTKIKKEGDNKGYGQKVGCSIVHGSCELCDAGYHVQPRWFLGVIDRGSNAFKLLDISYMVYQQIRALNSNKKWGDPQTYDINIIKNSKARTPQEWYTVQPSPKTPLSATDQSIRDQADLEELKRRVQPPSVETVQKRIANIVGDGKLAPPPPSKFDKDKPAATTKNGKATVPAVDMNADDDNMEDIFPSYNAD